MAPRLDEQAEAEVLVALLLAEGPDLDQVGDHAGSFSRTRRAWSRCRRSWAAAWARMAPRLIRRNREIGVWTLTRRRSSPAARSIWRRNWLCTWRNVGRTAVSGWPCSGTNLPWSGQLLANGRPRHPDDEALNRAILKGPRPGHAAGAALVDGLLDGADLPVPHDREVLQALLDRPLIGGRTPVKLGLGEPLGQLLGFRLDLFELLPVLFESRAPTLGIIAKPLGCAAGENFRRDAGAQRGALRFLENEIVGEKLLGRVGGLGDALRPVVMGVGEDMVKLVDDHAGDSAPEDLLTLGGLPVQQFLLNELADAIAVDFAERKDRAVADVGPAERAGMDFFQGQSFDIAAAFKGQNR